MGLSFAFQFGCPHRFESIIMFSLLCFQVVCVLTQQIDAAVVTAEKYSNEMTVVDFSLEGLGLRCA